MPEGEQEDPDDLRATILSGDYLDSCCDECGSSDHATKDHPVDEDAPVL